LIKYLGSKRTLVPVLGAIAQTSQAKTALDLFTGTTRVAQEYKKQGLEVTAVDIASYSKVLAQTYIETDARDIDIAELEKIKQYLMSLPGHAGYFTKAFCEDSHFFQPKNGMRIDSMRNAIEEEFSEHPFYPVLLTTLMLAADRVDSTTGVQMAYLKQWAARAHNDIELRIPELLPGKGHARLGDATELAKELGRFDLAYLDPPYNQHRYYTNYHIWETLVRWDAPEYYGKACKRIDARDDVTKSSFNSKRAMPETFRETIENVDAEIMVISYNNESWVSADDIKEWLKQMGYGRVAVFDYDFKRYVGAQIGIFNFSGERVGDISHTRNVEHVIIAGPEEKISRIESELVA